MIIKLIRTATSDAGTFGVLVKDGLPLCDTVEKPWADNHPQTSCIPAGLYAVEPYISPSKSYEVWLLKDVPGRSYIEIHIANFARELLGCIAPGNGYIQGSEWGVAGSVSAFSYLKKILPPTFQLQIVNAF